MEGFAMKRGLFRSIFFLSVVHLCSLSPTFSQIPTNGLVAYYPLNGNAVDQSSSGYNGTVIGATPAMDRFGRPNYALRFNGSTNYIRLGNILNSVFCAPVAQFTVSGWANSDGYPPYPLARAIVAKSAGGIGPYQWSVSVDNDHKLKGLLATKADASAFIDQTSGILPIGRWFHFVFVFDGSLPDSSRSRMYVDNVAGSLIRLVGTLGTSTENITQELTIGAGHVPGNPGSPNNQFTGSVDDVRIYNRVLNTSEIDALFHENGWGSNPPAWGEYASDASTLLLVHMNEFSGSTAADASVNHADGTTIGTSIVAGKFGNARGFNGTTDFIEGPSSNLVTAGQNFTLEAWIKTFSSNGQAIITTHNPGTSSFSNTGLYLGAGGYFDMDINNGSGAPSQNVNGRKINDGRWHHVAGVRNVGTIALYIDGRFDFQKSITQDPFSSTLYRIGQTYPGSFFNGSIDEVRISSKARQPNEFNLQLPPVNLTATTVSSSVNLTWQNGGGGAPLQRYRIYRGLDSTAVSLIDSSTSPSYSNSGLAGGKTYFFRVSAVDSTGFEAAMSYSASASVIAVLGEYSPDANTVLLLHMDEAFGAAVADGSSFNTSGTAFGTTIVGGRFSNARSFNGTSDYIEGATSNMNFGINSFTLEAWINTTSSTAQAIFTTHSPPTSKYSNAGLYIAGGVNGGYLNMDIDNGSGTSNVNGKKVNDGQWHHVAGVLNSSTNSLYVYVDGKLDFSKLFSSYPYGSTLYRVGQSNSGSYFNGLIDEVRISNIVRQPAQFDLQLAPVNLTATAVANSINLGWQNGGGAIPVLRYKIYRGADSTNVVLLDSTSSTFYTDAGLISGRKYYYRVCATDAAGFDGAKGYAASAVALSLTGEYTSDANTVLLVHMDEFGGTDVPDASTFNTGGTATGSTVVTGRFGNGRSFNGTTDYVEGASNNLISSGQNFTFEAWINTLSNSGGAIFSTHNPGAGKYGILVLSLGGGVGGGYLDVDINNGQGTSAVNVNGRKVNDGLWHHIAAVRLGTTLSLYVDGKLDFQKTVVQEPNVSTLYRIAQNNSGGFFQGLVDEIRISNKARLPNEFDLQLPPVNISATPVSNAINLSWSNGGGINGLLRYKIYRGTDSTAVVPIDSTISGTYSNAGLTNGKTYFYRISAVDATGFEGARSYAVNATTPALTGEYFSDLATLLLLHLDEGTGSVLTDASRFTLNGSVTGTSIVAGRFGNARSFNGTTDFIEGYPTNMNLAGLDFTIEAWIKTTSISTQAVFTTHNPPAGSYSSTGLYIITGSGTLDIDINNGQGTSASSSNGRKINDGAWHHVAGVRKGSAVTLYVDGRFDSQKSVTQEPNPAILYRVGKSYTSNSFSGIIEELRVSNVARQPGEFKLQLPPVNIAATVGGNIVSLVWQNGGGAIGLLRYRIYRGTDSTNVTLLDSTATTVYSNTGLTPGRAYYYRVSAVDSLGFEGIRSYTASALIPALSGEYSADATTVLLLHMNESSGSVVSDATSYNSHGTATGTGITFGRFGNARSFNGTSDFVEGPSPNLNFAGQSFTMEAWINTTSTAGQAVLTTHNTSTGMYDNVDLSIIGGTGGGFLDMNINGGQGSPSVNTTGRRINDGRWHHVAGVRSGSAITLYVDGRFDFLKLVTQEPRSSTIYRIGQAYPGNYFNGVIDEVRISSKACQPNEFNLQLPPAGLVATTVGTSIGLIWTNGGGGIGLLRYRIYRGTDSTNVALLDSTTATSYLNLGLPIGRTYFYRVSAVDAVGFEGAMSYAASGRTGVDAIDREAIPDEFFLYQNYPNPFNPSTRITFSVPKSTHVQIRVLDLLGREVAVLVNGDRTPGTYEVQWDASAHPSGMYICRIQAGDFVQMRKMTLLK